MKIKKKVKEPVTEEIIEKPAMEEPIIEEIQEPAVEEPEFYVFKASDTLEKVALRFGTTVEKLKELNGNNEFASGNPIRVR